MDDNFRYDPDVVFGGAGLDRAAELRGDGAAMGAALADPTTRIIPFWRGKPALFEGENAIAPIPPGHGALDDMGEPPIYLGRDSRGHWFAADLAKWVPEEVPDAIGAFLDPTEQRHPALDPTSRFVELRAVMATLDAASAERLATAKALLGWHATHRHCARCGAESDLIEAGWQRHCSACGARHFPRTDPVVIMAIFHGNSVLVGRSPGWPEGMYSLLAGFVEPGETPEAATRREVFEEAGIRVGKVEYRLAQPWPFPASLMLGYVGKALGTAIVLDPAELEDARWISREEMAEIFRGQHAEIRAPRTGAVAHYMLRAWLADRL
ncbi:MAG: NAD(+) diphosphatase [Pseudomonadota bacterium]